MGGIGTDRARISTHEENGWRLVLRRDGQNVRVAEGSDAGVDERVVGWSLGWRRACGPCRAKIVIRHEFVGRVSQWKEVVWRTFLSSKRWY